MIDSIPITIAAIFCNGPTINPEPQQPQRTWEKPWVGLTDEEISELIRATHNTASFVRAIEAKLKEKNT